MTKICHWKRQITIYLKSFWMVWNFYFFPVQSGWPYFIHYRLFSNYLYSSLKLISEKVCTGTISNIRDIHLTLSYTFMTRVQEWFAQHIVEWQLFHLTGQASVCPKEHGGQTPQGGRPHVLSPPQGRHCGGEREAGVQKPLGIRGDQALWQAIGSLRDIFTKMYLVIKQRLEMVMVENIEVMVLVCLKVLMMEDMEDRYGFTWESVQPDDGEWGLINSEGVWTGLVSIAGNHYRSF